MVPVEHDAIEQFWTRFQTSCPDTDPNRDTNRDYLTTLVRALAEADYILDRENTFGLSPREAYLGSPKVEEVVTHLMQQQAVVIIIDTPQLMTMQEFVSRFAKERRQNDSLQSDSQQQT